jgi:hypothetical protein
MNISFDKVSRWAIHALAPGRYATLAIIKRHLAAPFERLSVSEPTQLGKGAGTEVGPPGT